MAVASARLTAATISSATGAYPAANLSPHAYTGAPASPASLASLASRSLSLLLARARQSTLSARR
jgi:hypothetical protein